MDNEYISTTIIIIIGITIGIIIGYYIFREIKYIGPDSNIISKKIYTDANGKQYKLVPKITVCPISYSMNKLHDPTFKESH
ncbi:MAG: hypothetical protein Gaeavirus12_13 [Gaeavirus sp.]|uniref:Uncharacterized protein n=1 Tax=Gaeavirus sp. TaxID=2487767 RepID=A0A3G4ZYX7_9VIRU|nr:MAG: hypothetical protein Gaeavirus12_4 [Gaeavirus sp.]AYV80155.1 MAG: hypothetical protein Gaeavirus12_13 [Gaeavirus sp.]